MKFATMIVAGILPQCALRLCFVFLQVCRLHTWHYNFTGLQKFWH